MSNENLLTIDNMRVWYSKDKNILNDFSISLKNNEVVGFIGLNGAGKTTFIKVLTGLLTSFEATKVSFEGKDNNFRDEGFKISRYAVFSEDNSFQFFTFKEYISYVFKAYRKDIPELTDMIKGFHFEEYTDMLLKDLSMGNRKKAFLITAFALKPKFLLLDEPVNGLDELIGGYKKHGTVLFSSHILESITLTSDRVLVLEDGKIRNEFVGEDINAARIREALRYDD